MGNLNDVVWSAMAYQVDEDRVLTKGMLFIRGCGRINFQGGDPELLDDSATECLFTFLEEASVCPGHFHHSRRETYQPA